MSFLQRNLFVLNLHRYLQRAKLEREVICMQINAHFITHYLMQIFVMLKSSGKSVPSTCLSIANVVIYFIKNVSKLRYNKQHMLFGRVCKQIYHLKHNPVGKQRKVWNNFKQSWEARMKKYCNPSLCGVSKKLSIPNKRKEANQVQYICEFGKIINFWRMRHQKKL